MIIETSNLIIEPICEKSLSYILKNIDCDFNTLVPKNASQYQINKFILHNDKIRCFNSLGYFVIKLKKDLSTIGFISIIPRYIHENLINELGYFMIEYYRNNNFMKEAIFHTLNYVFNTTNIDKIYSLVEDSNLISKHILLNIMMFNFIGSLPNCSKLTQIYYLTKSKFLDLKELIYIKINKCLIKDKRTSI